MENKIPAGWIRIPVKEFCEWIENDISYSLINSNIYTYYYKLNRKLFFMYKSELFAISISSKCNEKVDVWVDPKYLNKVRKEDFSIMEYIRNLFFNQQPLAA